MQAKLLAMPGTPQPATKKHKPLTVEKTTAPQGTPAIPAAIQSLPRLRADVHLGTDSSSLEVAVVHGAQPTSNVSAEVIFLQDDEDVPLLSQEANRYILAVPAPPLS